MYPYLKIKTSDQNAWITLGYVNYNLYCPNNLAFSLKLYRFLQRLPLDLPAFEQPNLAPNLTWPLATPLFFLACTKFI